MAHKALGKIMLYKALKIPLIRPCKSLYNIIRYSKRMCTHAQVACIYAICYIPHAHAEKNATLHMCCHATIYYRQFVIYDKGNLTFV